MAKNDNLTDFLTDVADAIRRKKGTMEAISPQDFSSEIDSIESGGGEVADSVHNFTGELIDVNAVGRTNYKTIIVKDGVIEVLPYAFYGFSGVLSAHIPDTVTTVGNYAFYNCDKMESIRLSNNQTIIDDNTFYGCKNLTHINIPNSVTEIQTQAFMYCTSLEDITLPSSVTKLGGSIFRHCASLKMVIIEGDLSTNIGANTFSGCTSLEVIDLSNSTTVKKMGASSAFTNVPTTCKIVVPDNLYNSWITTTNWSSIASQIIKKSDYDAL